VNVLGRLILLESKQEAVLKEICAGTIISSDDLDKAQKPYMKVAKSKKGRVRNPKQGELLA
jgi:hypothetical protein